MVRGLSSLLAAAVLVFAAPGATTASVTALPRLSVCEPASDLRPDYILLGCGDGGQFLASVRWSVWNRVRAAGSAVWWQNLCTPDCAAGKFRRDRVTVLLSRPRACVKPRRFLFTRMTLIVSHAAPVHVKVPTSDAPHCP